MPPKKRSVENFQVRLDKQSNQLINMYRGELELNTAKTFTVAETISTLFETCRPDLINRLKQIDSKSE